MEDNNSEKRFYAGRLYEDTNAQVEFFQPDKTGRDKYGNRLFSSSKLAFSNREGQSVKAALLVSREGEAFIKSNKGILNLIDKGLLGLEQSFALKLQTNDVVDLGPGVKMSGYLSGDQSQLYLLEVNGEKFIIKRPAKHSYLHQPYINEMLQVQEIASNERISWLLKDLGVFMPQFLFASGQIACIKFEAGLYPSEEELLQKAAVIYKLVENYVLKQQEQGNRLWDNIKVDFEHEQLKKYRAGDFLRTNNFIKRDDGSLVWVDPFYYGFKT